MEPTRRMKLITAAVVAAVFTSGAVLGFAADRAFGPEAANAADVPPRRRPPVYTQMNPTAEQLRIIDDSILPVHSERMRRLHEEFAAQQAAYQANYDGIIDDTKEAIAALFSPERAAEYRRLFAESKKKRDEERARESSPR